MRLSLKAVLPAGIPLVVMTAICLFLLTGAVLWSVLCLVFGKFGPRLSSSAARHDGEG